MPSIRTSFLCAAFVLAASAFAQNANTSAAQDRRAAPAHVVELKSSDGTPLKATYFAAAKPGPGVLLLHQSTRDRKSWDLVAAQFAAAGFNPSRWTCAGSAKAAARVGISSACLKMLMPRWSS